MDDTDVEILKAIYDKSHIALVGPLFLIEKFSTSDEKIGDWLEMMVEKEYVKVKRDTYAPGISLLNGINKVGITRQGTEFLRTRNLTEYKYEE